MTAQRPALGLADEDILVGDFSRLTYREAMAVLQRQHAILQQFASCKERPVVIVDVDLADSQHPVFWVTDADDDGSGDEEQVVMFG